MVDRLKKITSGPKVFFIGIISITIGFILEVLSLLFKSVALERLSVKAENIWAIIIPILYFALLSVFNSQLSILFGYIKDKIQTSSFEEAWNQFIPLKIKENTVSRSEDFFEIIYEQIPSLTGINIERIEKVFYAFFVSLFFAFQMNKNDFYEVLYIVPILFITAYFSSEILKKQYQDSTEEIINERPRLIHWLGLFFKSNREFSFNLKSQSPKTNMKTWLKDQGQKASEKLIKNSKVSSYRSFYASLLNDLPYIVTICALIIFSKFKGLNLSSTLIWIGIIDHLIQATEAVKDFKDLGIEKEAITAQVYEKVINQITSISPSKKEDFSEEDKNKVLSFLLSDNNKINISFKPGIYNLKGGNGSGKTTLWKTLINFNDHYQVWKENDIQKVRSFFKDDIRIIERNPGIMPEWKSFEKQVIGFNNFPKNNFWSALFDKLDHVLPSNLSGQWKQKFILLEKAWISRQEKSFSSGECVVLSLARILFFWDEDIKLIISDECDSFLDAETRELFLKTMAHFSKKKTIWFISHTHELENFNRNVI